MVKAIILLQMELKEKFRYKIELFSASTDALLLVFPAIAIFLFGDLKVAGVTSRMEYIQYMLFSLILWQFVENMWSAVFEIRRKLKEGNFEYMMCMPLKGIHYIFGWAVGGVISMVLEMIPLIVLFLITSFHLLSFKALLTILAVTLIMAFGTYGFAEMLMGVAIYVREADQIVSCRTVFSDHSVTESIYRILRSVSVYLGTGSCQKHSVWKCRVAACTVRMGNVYSCKRTLRPCRFKGIRCNDPQGKKKRTVEILK